MDPKLLNIPKVHYLSIIMTRHQHCRTEIVGEEPFCKISPNWALLDHGPKIPEHPEGATTQLSL